MESRIATLTDRERETLRLLARGHDAKSIARHLELSVHTINERLRDIRRKLEVSSSREAARMLAETEQDGPDFSGDKFLGVSATGDEAPVSGKAKRLVWFGGGMILMSLLIAAVALSSAFQGGSTGDAQNIGLPATATSASASASLSSAREWLGLLDRQDWEGGWRAAAPFFQSQISAAQWASTIQGVRQPLGKMASRTFQNVTKADSLPGAPAGEYEVLQFRTDFASKNEAIETVTLVKAGNGWRVVGYFIR